MSPPSSRFDVLLLDLNGTFMFGHDRFGPDERYDETYRELGGERLAASEVERATSELVAWLSQVYEDPDLWDAFPSVADALARLPVTRGLPAVERQRLERVLASHELGHVPAAHAALVHSLSRSHRLGLCSNLWSRKGPWLAELSRAGLGSAFEVLLFSSDGPHVKPSPRFFEPVLRELGAPRSRVLMIGDSLSRDVAGARAAGVASLWLSGGSEPPSGSPEPDFVLGELLELADKLAVLT